MRRFRLVIGLCLTVGGFCGAGYFFVERNEFDGGDSAYSITESVAGHKAPVGMFSNLTLAGASLIIAVVGVQLARKNWSGDMHL